MWNLKNEFIKKIILQIDIAKSGKNGPVIKKNGNETNNTVGKFIKKNLWLKKFIKYY